MESRVLSYGATATTVAGGIPRLTKPAARLNTVAVSFPARLNADGGNLVCGRQLRPSLLLNLDHSSASAVPLLTSTAKRDVLKPCSATASDSAGWDPFASIWIWFWLNQNCKLFLTYFLLINLIFVVMLLRSDSWRSIRFWQPDFSSSCGRSR